MKRTLLVCVVLTAGAADLPALGQGQDPYAGTSNPPQDDILVTSGTQPIPKPSAGRPLVRQQAAPASTRAQQPATRYTGPADTDAGIVQRSPESSYQDPESAVYQPVQPSNRYNPAPVNRSQPTQSAQQANPYPSEQTDPYYQDAPTTQYKPVQSNRYQSQQVDPYYQDAPAATPRPAQNSQNQPQDPYYQQAPTRMYRPGQTTRSANQQVNPNSQSTQQDPYYQQAPTQMYRPGQTSRSTNQQSQQADPYVQGSQNTPYVQSQQNGTNYPSNQSAPYNQSGQGNPSYQEPSPYGNTRYQGTEPTLSRRTPSTYDPDGDIVHPSALGPQQLAEGTTIRVHLLGRISSASAVNGDRFRTRVVNDVIQNGRVLIPADSEIDGRIYDISRGHIGSGGYMHLRPETVTLRDGTRFKLYAQVTGAPGANAHVGTEGTVKAGSRMKRNGIEYGSAMGLGAGTGAYLGGPVGALAGTAIGAGVISVHLLVSHSQATLETGTPLQFTLTQRLSLVPSPYGD